MPIQTNRGIALFIAVIAVSALFLIGASISDLTYKEGLISYSGRDSKIAFYAADTGVECAMFYDLQGGYTGAFAFATSTGSISTADDNMLCNSSPVNISVQDSATAATTTLSFESYDPNVCTVVVVSKYRSGSAINTKIESRGYNNECDNSLTGADRGPERNIRNLERSFVVMY